MTAAALALPPGAAAAPIGVTTTADTFASDGQCSLREAIRAANDDAATGGCPAGAGADTITLAAGRFELTRGGAGEDAGLTGDLDVTEALTLRGSGSNATTVDANAIDRVLQVFANVEVSVVSLTITGGQAPRGGGGADGFGTTSIGGPGTAGQGGVGGAGQPGGGVANQGALTLTSVGVVGNTAGPGGAGGSGHGGDGGTGLAGGTGYGGQGGGGGDGGGIWNSGTLTIADSTIASNAAGDGGDGAQGYGGNGGLGSGGVGVGGDGGAGFGGPGGGGGDGGGIFNVGGTSATITRTSIVDNRAGEGGRGGDGEGGDGGFGGGTLSQGGGALGGSGSGGGDGGAIAGVGRVTITASTLARNATQAGGGGGGAAKGKRGNGTGGGYGDAGGGSPGGSGGAIANHGTITATNVTITENSTGQGGFSGLGLGGQGGNGGAGAGAWNMGGSIVLVHATIARNTTGLGGPGNVSGAQSPVTGLGVLTGTVEVASSIVVGNCSGVTDGGNNLPAPGSGCPGVAGSARLGSLSDNGGPTPTLALAADSDAIDRVAPATAGCRGTDQRGAPRPFNGACDAGAYEWGAVVPSEGGGGGPGGGPGPGGAPRVSAVAVTPDRFAVGGKATALSAAQRRVPRGTTIRFRLSEVAGVTIAIQRRATGLKIKRKRGKARCAAASARRVRKAPRRKRCVRWPTSGVLQRAAVAGANRVAFSGRLGRRALRPGRYRVAVTAAGTGGAASRPATDAFTVIAARPN